MLSEYPYPGFTWQISQHVGIVRESNVLGLLRACAHLDGMDVDIADIDAKIAEQGVISSETDRSIWRDYQQVLCEFGFMFPTASVGDEIRLTPVAKEIMSGRLTFTEALTNQLLKYQYPNGKSTITKGLKKAFVGVADRFTSLTAVQEHYDIRIRPLPFTWLVLDRLSGEVGREQVLSAKEIAICLFRCHDIGEIDDCCDTIRKVRSGESHLALPTWNVLRNAQDWVALMGMTRFFVKTSAGIKRSSFSIKRQDIVRLLFESLCDISSFWMSDENGSASWYEFLGTIEDPLRDFIVCNGKQMWDFFPSVITANVLNTTKSFLEDKQ